MSTFTVPIRFGRITSTTNAAALAPYWAVIDHVARAFNVSPTDILSRRRPPNIAWARQVAMHLITTSGGISPNKAAIVFARHPGTICYANRCVEQRLSVYPKERARIEQLKAALQQRP